MRRRLWVLVLATVAVGWLTGRVYRAAHPAPYAWLLVGALAAGVQLSGGVPPLGRRRVVRPVMLAVSLFVAFAVAGFVARVVPAVDHAVSAALARSSASLLPAVAVAGAAEEAFYRGAWFERLPLPVFTAGVVHALATLPAGNVAVTLAALALGPVLGLSRRVNRGWWAPAVAHVAWSLLVVWLLPR